MSLVNFWPFRRREDSKKAQQAPPSELRIATSGSFSIRASVEVLARVDGAGSTSCSQASRMRAALFVPSTMTTVQFHGDNIKKPSASARSSCVHVLQMLTPSETAQVLNDAMRIGTAIGWSDRGVSLPTQDVLVQSLSKESQEMVHKAIREQLLPFARRHYPHLNGAFDKQPYPRPGNLFIVRYSAASGRPGGRGLKLHKDETALTFNMCLSPQDGFEGGGTYFPASSGDVDGILLRPTPGYCLVHDGNIKHAGNDVMSGDRYILVGFYNADGRDRAGEEAFFSKRALEEARAKLLSLPPLPVQTIYFTTAVATARGGLGSVPTSSTQKAVLPLHPHCESSSSVVSGCAWASNDDGGESDAASSLLGGQSERRNLSSVAIQGPLSAREEEALAFRLATAAEVLDEVDDPLLSGRPSERLPSMERARGEDGTHEREPMRGEQSRGMAATERMQGLARPKADGRPSGKMDGWLDGWVSGCSPRGLDPRGSSAVVPSPATSMSYDPLGSGGPMGGDFSLAPLGSVIPAPSTPTSRSISPSLSPVSQQAGGSEVSVPLYSSLATTDSHSGCSSSNSSSSSNEGGDGLKRLPPNERARRPPRPTDVGGSAAGSTRGSSTVSCMPNWPLVQLLRGSKMPRQ